MTTAQRLPAGASPFAAAGHAETMRRIVLHQPGSLGDEVPGVPAALAELVDQLLDKNPLRRPRRAIGGPAASQLREVEHGLTAVRWTR